MPELPEVETIRRQLSEKILGQAIVGVEVHRERCYIGIKKLRGERIKSIKRTGKYLFILFESQHGLVVHLKMTGRLVYDVDFYETAPHTRVVLTLGEGHKLYFWDVRTFGYIKYEEKIEEIFEKQSARIGQEPWQMTTDEFYTLCQKYKRPIKNLILDQGLVGGVGNIYANDGLWEAGIDPRRGANTLSKKEAKLLLMGLCKVMERGLITGGASDNSYVNALGQKGKYQEEFRVYKRTGQACLACGNKIERVVVGGRGSFVCIKCQK